MVGQDHITRTLRNALLRERTAHAYLFVGPRGIGKTTIARIYAKALNCAKAPAEEPCCECEACVSIANGNCIDVIEIDGASNNKVEDVRDLREAALYTPTSCRYKIYIIDEVHMLSAGAWNALLKIVEEPPKHVKFIFATTEAHKVLPTIVSRCQRLDLRRISSNVIAERLLQIATAEGVPVDRKAAEAVAKAADGGMRDALSLLDQLIAFHAGEQGAISEDLAISVFGLASSHDMEELVRATIHGDAAGIVSLIHTLAESGKNLENVLEDVLDALRGVGICLITANPGSILDEGEEALSRYRGLAAETTPDLVQKLLEQLSPIGRTLHDALNKQVYLETAMIKASRIARSPRVEDIVSRLNELRGQGGLAVLDSVPSQTIQRPPPQAARPPPPAPVARPPQNPPPPPPPPLAVKPAQSAPLPPVVPKAPPPETAPLAPVVPPLPPPARKIEEPSPLAAVPPTVPRASKTVAPPPAQASAPPPSTTRQEAPAPSSPPPSSLSGERVDEKSDNHEPRFVKLPSAAELWHKLILEMDHSHVNRPQLKHFMQEGRPESVDHQQLTIAYDEDFEQSHARQVMGELPLLEKCLHRLTGLKGMRVNVRIQQGIVSKEETLDDEKDLADVRAKVEKNPFVQDVMRLFNGKIIDVRG